MPPFTSGPPRSAGRGASFAVAIVAILAVLGTGAAPALAQKADVLEAGRAKFVQCASCHGSDGRSTVVAEYPKIGGQTAAYVVNALKAYRDGRRLGTYAAIMAEVAKPLSDADIANLAAYVESLDTPR